MSLLVQFTSANVSGGNRSFNISRRCVCASVFLRLTPGLNFKSPGFKPNKTKDCNVQAGETGQQAGRVGGCACSLWLRGSSFVSQWVHLFFFCGCAVRVSSGLIRAGLGALVFHLSVQFGCSSRLESGSAYNDDHPCPFPAHYSVLFMGCFTHHPLKQEAGLAAPNKNTTSTTKMELFLTYCACGTFLQ